MSIGYCPSGHFTHTANHQMVLTAACCWGCNFSKNSQGWCKMGQPHQWVIYIWVNIEKLCTKVQRDANGKSKSSSLCALTEIWDEMGQSEPALPCMHFSIAILVFLFPPFFWLLLSALLTILITVLRVLFFWALFPADFLSLCHVFLFISLLSHWLHGHLAAGAISPKHALQICLFFPVIFAPAPAPVIFELSSFFLAEVLTSRAALLLSLPFSCFTAAFSMSLPLFSTTNTTTSKLPLCFLSSSLSWDSPHWISHKDPCKDHRTPRNPCQSDEICIGPTCADSDSPFEPPTSIMNSAVHMVSCKDDKLSTGSCRGNKSRKGSLGASHYMEASKR